MQNLLHLSIAQLLQGYKQKAFSPKEVYEAYQKQITKMEPAINSYITITKGQTEDVFRPSGPLGGIPFSLKDNICTKGIATTCASRLLKDFTPFYSATVYHKLLQAGAALLGKNNMDEFSMGATTESSFFGPSKNPWNISHAPGGSSGGGAAATAAFTTPLALGSDTGGSIRQPASFCGVVGFKPSYGWVSRYGLIAFASTLDQIGTFTKTVEDCALVMNTMGGQDEKDATTLTDAPSIGTSLSQPVKGLTIGIPKELMSIPMAPAITKAWEEGIRLFTSLGAKIKEISLPLLPYLPSAYYIISSVEAASNLARFDGIPFAGNPEAMDAAHLRSLGFGKEVKRRIMLGTLMAGKEYQDLYYKKALNTAEQLKKDLAETYMECDAILSPVSPATAPLLGQQQEEATKDHPGDIFTIPANLAGLPALSLPFGFDNEGLPVGLQLMGAFGKDSKVLHLGHAAEKALAFPFWEVEKRWA